jgi:hypothetical protein
VVCYKRPSVRLAFAESVCQEEFAVQHRLFVASTLAVLLGATGCAVVAPPAETVIRGGGIKPIVVMALSGSVMAPSGVIAAGSGNVIAPGAGNLIGQAGGNVIASGGGNLAPRALLALSESPVAGADVFLADAAGKPIPGLQTTRTDAQGRYQLFNVPKGYTFVVGVRVKTAAGKDATLQTLARPADRSLTANVSTATTVLTAAAVEGQADLGALDSAKFQAAASQAGPRMAGQAPIDLADRAQLLGAVDRLQQADPTLTPMVAAVRTSLQDTSVSLEALKKQLASRLPGDPQPWITEDGQAVPKPTPTPTAAPTEPPVAQATARPTAAPTQVPAEPTPEPTQAPSPAELRRLSLFADQTAQFFANPAYYPMTVRLSADDGTFDASFPLASAAARIDAVVLCRAPLTITYTVAGGASVRVAKASLPLAAEGSEVPLPLPATP